MRCLPVIFGLLLSGRLPETIARPSYFLERINTPLFWWGIRMGLAVVLILVIGGCLYHGKKMKDSKKE